MNYYKNGLATDYYGNGSTIVFSLGSETMGRYLRTKLKKISWSKDWTQGNTYFWGV